MADHISPSKYIILNDKLQQVLGSRIVIIRNSSGFADFPSYNIPVLSFDSAMKPVSLFTPNQRIWPGLSAAC